VTLPLFVGELNPYGSSPEYALFCEPPHSAGGRLCRLVCGLRRSTYLKLPRVNLCTGKWSMTVAKSNAEIWKRKAAGTWNVVLLGRKAATAFGYADADPFTTSRHYWPSGGPSGIAFIALPHPSGLCRAWNEPGAFERARALLREVCPEVPWGEALKEERPRHFPVTDPKRVDSR